MLNVHRTKCIVSCFSATFSGYKFLTRMKTDVYGLVITWKMGATLLGLDFYETKSFITAPKLSEF